MQPQVTPEYLASQGLSPTFAERFWSKVNKEGPIPDHMPHLGRCWTWAGYFHPKGYAYIGRNGGNTTISAHVASWILNRGPVPQGMCVCHHCDSRCCTRPDHLFLGTQSDNLKDASAKGRTALGERHPMVKLTERDVFEIRNNWSNNTNELASEFGVNPSAIIKIIRRERWKHI